MTQPVPPGYSNPVTLQSVSSADPWDSGVPEFQPGAGQGYISSGELLAWLAMVGGNTYDDMREQMMATEQRAALQEDLGHIKAVIEETQSTKDLAKLQGEIAAVMEKYEGTEFEERVNALFGERLKAFQAIDAAATDLGTAAQELGQVSSSDPEDPNQQAAMSKHDQARKAYDNARSSIEGQLDSWKTDVESKLDKLGKDDQLALIRIQELNARINQATQTASNLLASQDQAKSAAIMNLKG